MCFKNNKFDAETSIFEQLATPNFSAGITITTTFVITAFSGTIIV
jgi:hypothetical protein